VELARWGGIRPCLRIIRAVFAALADPAGVAAHRPGALERAHLALGDWRDIRARLADAEARMCAVMDELGLAELVSTIRRGLAVTGAAAILAETGDPGPFATPRGPGQARRAVPARRLLRRRPGQDLPFRARPARPAARRLAGRLGGDAEQPGDGRPVRLSHHPPGQPAAGKPALPARPPCCAGSTSWSPGMSPGPCHRRREHVGSAGRMTATTQH
jgi:hypothetical protein